MYYTYILILSNTEYYTGHTDDLRRRLQEHIEGRVQSTKSYRPLKLIYYSAFVTKTKAIAFEKYLKSSSGKAFRNKRLV